MSFIIENNYGKSTRVLTKNGRRVIIGGGTITIVNGKVTVDGKPISEFETENGDEKVVNITIEGSVEHLEVEYCDSIKITGDCKRVKTNNGDIEIGGDVNGDVHTNMGSITCGNVEGDCHTNMGSIYRK